MTKLSPPQADYFTEPCSHWPVSVHFISWETWFLAIRIDIDKIDISIFDFCKIPYRYFKIFTSQYEIFGLLTSPTNDKSSWPPFFCQLCVSFQIYYMYVQQSLPAHVYHFHPRSKLFAWIKFYMLSQVMFRFSATNPEHYLIKSMHLPMPENKKAQYLFCSSRLLAWLNRKNITKYFSALNK